MRIKQFLMVAIFVVSIFIGFRVVAVAQSSSTQTTPPPSSILNVETSDLPKGSVLESEMLAATMVPKEVSIWHTHRSPVFAYTISGAYVVDFQSGKPSITIPAGKAIMEPINEVVRARNPSSQQPAKLVLFQVREPGTPFLDPINK